MDLVRSLLGEVTAVTATGDPPANIPTVPPCRPAPRSRKHVVAEVRIVAGRANRRVSPSPAIKAHSTLEYHPTLTGQARLTHRTPGTELVADRRALDPHAAILDVLASSLQGQDARPNLLDGTRAMELAEATARSP